jgi:DNA-directed RNA polymerase specialized sigma24 family protein
MTEVLEMPPATYTATWLDIYKRPQLFFAALLITGALESAIEDSMDLVDMETAPRLRAALTNVVTSAVTRIVSFNPEARSLLPEELRAVADLPLDLRVCFVLRRLAGLTALKTAELVGIGPRIVDRRALDASIRLAQGSLHAA